jgi:ABC-type spermidine/putrescine transport system permease subunit II
MPQLLIGLALLFYFAQMQVSGSYGTLLLGHILVTFPYVVQVILAALPGVSRTLEEASMTLGANEVKTLFKVTLPMIGPAVRGGAMFSFMASYNNVLISLFLSVPRIEPMPIKIYGVLEWGADPSVAAISTLFLILTFVILIILQRTVKLELIPDVKQPGS